MSDTTDVKTIRVKHGKEKPYFLLARNTAQDTNLSYEALGLLVYLLSKPDDWQVMIVDLSKRIRCGKNKAYRILNELIDARYMERVAIRNEKGLFVKHEYHVHEEPLPQNPDVDNPDADNGTLHNTDKEHNTEETIAANAAPRITGEKQVKPAKPRNPLFDTVAAYSFGLRNVDVPKEAAGRIGKIVRFCRGNDVAVDELISFYAWYAKTVGAAHPRDVAKFAEHLTAYRATKASHSHFPPGYIPVAERTSPLDGVRWFEG